MTEKDRKIALYCLKANSDYHSEVCEECINHPNCDHAIQDDVTETIIKALEQEPCEDAISRQAAKEKLIELCNELESIFADIREKEVNDCVCGLCEYDCDHGISGFANECPGYERDDCFKLKDEYKKEWSDISDLTPVTPQLEKVCVDNIHFDEEKFEEICKNATLTILDDSNTPTIQPKMGRWVTQMIFSTKLKDEPLREYECSECGRRIRCTKSQLVNYPYCHCGAKMEVEG